MMSYCSIYILLTLLLSMDCLVALPECKPEETIYTYSECDGSGGRWSIKVPKNPQQCRISKPEPPVWGNTCSYSCDAGHYLDLANQTCQKCPIGTYSLGSGIRFDSWNELPEGFATHSETLTFAQYGYTTKADNCNSSLWKTSGHSVISNNDDCTSTLTYSVDLKQPGYVSFSYQYPDSDVIFHFFTQNSECQVSQVRSKNVFLNTTGTEWKTWKVTLREGPNVLNWQTTGITLNSQKKLNPVRIRNIEITGVSYTTKCHRCRDGYFAAETASAQCSPCPTDTYSPSGSSTCYPCRTPTEYAPQASAACIAKPPCKSKDFFMTHSACGKDHMASIAYKWIEPKICLETLAGSVTLPPSGKKQPCSPCNPGFHPTNTGCVPCSPNTFSNGSHDCQQCPASTSPHYGYFYLWWDYLPKNMKTSCISLSSDSCVNKKGWEAVGDQIQTLTIDSDEAYLVLVISLEGFMSAIDENTFGQITFAFETECEEDCQLYFMKDVRDEGAELVEGWTGRQAKQTYSYVITTNQSSLSFTWVFKKVVNFDVARIYFINVTNAIGSSADTCLPCAAGVADDSKCIPCPTGNYLDVNTRSCKPCTGNTVLTTDKTSCVECGPGTTANVDHLKCTSDCHFISPTTNRHYDFTNLSLPTSARTLPSFTSSGRQYNHVYNFSLCNNEGSGNAQCVDNVTYAHSGLFNVESLERLNGMVCRSTAVPMIGVGGQRLIVHSQPTLIASTLISISQSHSSNTTANDVFPKDESSDLDDVIFHMSSTDYQGECSEGRHTYVHLRCSPSLAEPAGVIEMMSKCPDGTCDGCDFHFLWRSAAACPKCAEKDYKKVVQSCQNGKVETSYLWNRYPRKCHDGVELPATTSENCTELKVYIEIAVLCAAAVLLLTCVLVCFLYKKNKKLEYKYHRLVVGGVGDKDDPELPAADSCGISDSDSDFDGTSDEVIFQKKKSRLIGKSRRSDSYRRLVNMFRSPAISANPTRSMLKFKPVEQDLNSLKAQCRQTLEL